MSEPLPDPATSKRGFDVAGASGPRAVLWGTVLPVWFAALACSVVVAVVAPTSVATWLSIAFGLSVLVAFALQLCVPTVAGHISRLGWGVGGALVILAVTSGLLFLL